MELMENDGVNQKQEIRAACARERGSTLASIYFFSDSVLSGRFIHFKNDGMSIFGKFFLVTGNSGNAACLKDESKQTSKQVSSNIVIDLTVTRAGLMFLWGEVHHIFHL